MASCTATGGHAAVFVCVVVLLSTGASSMHASDHLPEFMDTTGSCYAEISSFARHVQDRRAKLGAGNGDPEEWLALRQKTMQQGAQE